MTIVSLYVLIFILAEPNAGYQAVAWPFPFNSFEECIANSKTIKRNDAVDADCRRMKFVAPDKVDQID